MSQGRVEQQQREPTRPNSGRATRLPTAGAELNVIDTGGRGPAVVLLHALPFNSSMWAPQIGALSEFARVIAVDLKGFGKSDAPSDASAYSMEAYADELKQVIDQLRLPRVILVGLALGGWVALAFYRRYPELVSGLVLADTRPDSETPEGKVRRLEQQRLAATGGVKAVAGTWHELLTSAASRRTNPQLGATLLELMDERIDGFVGALEAVMNRPDMTSGLRNIRIPTLIIVGEEDRISPPALSRQMHDLIPGSMLAILPHAGTLTNLEAAIAFNDLLIEFIADHGRR